MSKFPFEDCKIRWWKEAKISAEDKQALISDLRNTSDIIKEAMNFTIKREQRNSVVKFSIGPKDVFRAYSLRVFYMGKEGWSISINRRKFDRDGIVVSDDILAEIVCRKWQLIMVLDEEDYGPVEEL
jgi:hypothetical protein